MSSNGSEQTMPCYGSEQAMCHYQVPIHSVVPLYKVQLQAHGKDHCFFVTAAMRRETHFSASGSCVIAVAIPASNTLTPY